MAGEHPCPGGGPGRQDRADRRRVRLRCAAEGRMVVDDLANRFEARTHRLVEWMPPADLAVVDRFLRAVDPLTGSPEPHTVAPIPRTATTSRARRLAVDRFRPFVGPSCPGVAAGQSSSQRDDLRSLHPRGFTLLSDRRATICDVPVMRDVGVILSEWSARRTLRRMIDEFGLPGLVAARRSPGLGAALDQHVAAVRDLLDDRPFAHRSSVITRMPARELAPRLAAYARSLLEEQRRGGGAVPMPRAGEWERADWLTLRLLAICHLGREAARRG